MVSFSETALISLFTFECSVILFLFIWFMDCTMKLLPYSRSGAKLSKDKRKKCHWCRRSSLRILIKCSSCQKHFFCLDCIKDRFFSFNS